MNMLAVSRGVAFTPGTEGALPEDHLSWKTILGVDSRHEEMPAETREHLTGH